MVKKEEITNLKLLLSYAFVDNTTKQVSKSYKDAYDAYAYQYREDNDNDKLCLIQNNKVIMILNTKIISVRWAIACASRVLYIFEKKYPNDFRPRQAIEASMRWLDKRELDKRELDKRELNAPTKTNRVAAKAAANAAFEAANAAFESANAAHADAAYEAADAARAAYAAARAAAYATTRATYAAAYKAATNTAPYTADYAAAIDTRSKEIAWQRRCLQSIVDRSIAILYLLKMQQNPKTVLPRDLQKLIMNFI